jgi:hypothetical protein
MYKKLIKFFLFLLFGLSTLTINMSSAKAVETCHESDGKIVFNVANNAIVSHDGGTTFDKIDCVTEPDGYKLILYKVLLCIEDPYVPGSAEASIGNTPLLNDCKATIFDSPDGKDIEILPGVETGILDGAESLILPINNYNYGVIIVSNHIQIKHSAEFVPKNDIGDNDDATMTGYGLDESGTFTGGNTCYTVADQATSYSTNSTAHTNSRGVNIAIKFPSMIGDTAYDTLALACETDPGITFGYQIEIIDSFNTRYRSGVKEPADGDGKTGCESSTWKTATGKTCSNTYGGHKDYFDPSADGVDLAGGQSAFVLVDNNLSIASNRATAKKIGYIIRFAKPLIISENTTQFKIEFSTKASISLDLDFSNSGNVYVKKMGVNPFGVRFKTKTRRARGSWR